MSHHAPIHLGLFGAQHASGRIARAARALGVRVHELPSPGAAAVAAVDTPLADAWTDPLALAPFAARCDVVSAVAEHVPAATLAAAAAFTSVRPAPTLLAVAQDRAREKAWLDTRAGHAAPWRVARSAHALGEAVAALLAADEPGAPAACFVKPLVRRAGGPPPVRVVDAAGAAAAWAAAGARPCVVERALAIDLELTVLVARAPHGAQAVYPVAMHHRVGTTLAWSVLPAPIPAPLARKAQRLAGFYATRLAVEGLLAVELFVLADGRLVVNELVPCPHPAFDATDAACATDQYEQLVRAVCALELGAVDLVVPAASVPLRAGAVAGLLAGRGPMEGERGAHAGDDASDTPLPPPLALPGTRVTWHRDRAACDPAARPEEVVGHLTATGETPEEAVARAQHAATVLRCTAHATAEDPPAVTTSPWRRPAVAGRGAVVPGFPWRQRFAVRP